MRRRRWIVLSALVTGLLVFWWFCLPDPLFQSRYSSVLEDREGRLLSASIASDGQWRFPEGVEVPDRFAKALLLYEDKRFYSHPGVDVLAMLRAIRSNIREGGIVSGGSTITMQLARLAGNNRTRSVLNKILECFQATRIESKFSKAEILSLYAAHAPFGGNVVGLEAACWRYFHRPPATVSWAEAAVLAVLPNQPSLIHLARNRDILRTKRDSLLKRMLEAGYIDQLTYELSLAEPLPGTPRALPNQATHLMQSLSLKGVHRLRSSIDRDAQLSVENILAQALPNLEGMEVHNAAALVLDVTTGEVLAYVGNVPSGSVHQDQVDIVRSNRSAGSLLKPFLYAAMLDDGKILPRSLVADIPILINGYAPKNFNGSFQGVVPADVALVHSLNVPAVLELKEYRYERFYDLLKKAGLTSLNQPADHYGLALVLGGAESSLWELTGLYASAARTLVHYFDHPGKRRYTLEDFHPPVLTVDSVGSKPEPEASSLFSAASLWMTMETLREMTRPTEQAGWQYFSNVAPVAWKTGTSFGLRDAWSIGVNARYAVGVWVGNADGEGRPGLTGLDVAAPLMFRVFSSLRNHAWFDKPLPELHTIVTCKASGDIAGPYCDATDSIQSVSGGDRSGICRFHKRIFTTTSKKYRVLRECSGENEVVPANWFVLPPAQEYFFRKSHLTYSSLPPLHPDCKSWLPVESGPVVLYPKDGGRLYIPKNLDGEQGQMVAEATHRNVSATLFWHLDGSYLGTTTHGHKMAFYPGPGKHVLTLMDENGASTESQFEIQNSNRQ